MIRCRASPLSVCALALWCTLFFAQLSPPVLLFAGPAALVLCAVSLSVLGLTPLRLRQTGTWLLAAGVGLTLGALRLWPPAGGSTGGLPLERIRGFSGVLTEDSTPAAGGVMAYRVNLRSVQSGGTSAGARGEVQVAVRGGPRLAWGRLVTAEGGIRAVREAGRVRLVSRVDRQDFTAGPYTSVLLQARAGLRAGIERRLAALSRPVAALLVALLLGDRAGVAAEEMALYRASGSLHVLALSGLHVTILYGAAAFLLLWVPDRRWRVALGSALLFPYLFLAGWSPSLGRAVIMLAAGALGYLLDRDNRPLDLLALAAAAILLADPSSSGELSFQLSFLALLGIILLGRLFARLLSPPLPRFVGLPLAVSLGAQAATTPLLLATFGAAFPAGALAALPLLPLVTAFLWGGLACLALSFLPVLPALAWPMSLLHRAILAVLRFFSVFPPLRATWQPWYWIPVAAGWAALLLLKPPARSQP